MANSLHHRTTRESGKALTDPNDPCAANDCLSIIPSAWNIDPVALPIGISLAWNSIPFQYSIEYEFPQGFRIISRHGKHFSKTNALCLLRGWSEFRQ